MSGTSTNVCIRIDTELKAQAEALFSELGMNLTTAFNIFLRQAVRESRIPFEITLDRPNRDTAAAMRDAARIARNPEVKGYADPEELFRDLTK
jgi:DNA-damage-inducible protein J